jgi:hypothetical protein
MQGKLAHEPSAAAARIMAPQDSRAGAVRHRRAWCRSVTEPKRTGAAGAVQMVGNLRAVQLLLGHTTLESTVRYLGIDVDDALSISKQVEV